LPENERTDARAERDAIGADFIVPVLAVAFTAYYLISTGDLTWEARSTGTVVGIALLGLCAAHLVRLAARALIGKAGFNLGGLLANTRYNRQRLLLLAMLAAFVASIPIVGTTLGLFLIMLGGMAVMGVRNWRTMLAIAGATAATVYLLFMVLLSSRLPRGFLETTLPALLGAGTN
jgi:hypothetical protein